LLYVFAFMFLFVFGGMTGVAVASMSLDIHWHDTYFVVAHFHFIMVGGTMTAYLAALHYWFPKMTGRMYPERLGVLSAAGVFGGFLLTFVPHFLLGNMGMPRRYHNYPEAMQPLHVLSTAGAFILGSALVVTLSYLLWAMKYGPVVGPNPWASASYEWRTASPPPLHNFEGVPPFERGPYDYTQEAIERERALLAGATSPAAPEAQGA
jgi:cytochrome c oxidase subunit 1